MGISEARTALAERNLDDADLQWAENPPDIPQAASSATLQRFRKGHAPSREH
jgi:hypothetical protein